MIKHVYPQAKVRLHSPGATRNLIIIVNGEKIYEKQKEGGLNEQKSVKLFEHI